MDAYDLYKPLRNHLQRISLLQGLGVIRAYLQNFQFGQKFPRDVEVHKSVLYARSPMERGVHEWELEVLAKEIILNAPDRGKVELLVWKEFSDAVNKLKNLENELTKRYEQIYKPNILIELYRIAHRQFPWQQRPNKVGLTRYYKIFGHPDMDALLQREIGLSAKTLYTLGLMFTGLYLDTFGIEHPIRVAVPTITNAELDRFVSRFASELADVREAIRASQSYDQDYAYTFNPLRAHPLVWVTLHGKRTLIAPVPTYLFQRFTEGVYYELCNTLGFSGPFGASFQQYVGEVTHAANASGRFQVLPEQRYRVGKKDKDSVDWIVSDETGHLFIECKTKKLTMRAKMTLASTEALDEELGKMAGFVIQAYKALLDAKAGHYSHWKPDRRPIYPIVVTLEEWFPFNDRITGVIGERVRGGLTDLRIDPSLCDEHPYTICSAAELEQALQVIEQAGIDAAMKERFRGERRRWLLSSALREAFPSEFAKIRTHLFPEASAEIGLPTP